MSSVSGAMDPDDMPLQHTWTLFLEKGLPRGLSKTAYANTVKPLGSFASIKAFWSYWNALPHPSALPAGSNLRLFKDGILPTWEHPANADGGKLSVVVPKAATFDPWMNVVLELIGENMECNGSICGVVLSIRERDNIINVWNNQSKDGEAVAALSLEVAEVIGAEFCIEQFYKPHPRETAKRSSRRKKSKGSGSFSSESGDLAALAVDCSASEPPTPFSSEPPTPATNESTASFRHLDDVCADGEQDGEQGPEDSEAPRRHARPRGCRGRGQTKLLKQLVATIVPATHDKHATPHWVQQYAAQLEGEVSPAIYPATPCGSEAEPCEASPRANQLFMREVSTGAEEEESPVPVMPLEEMLETPMVEAQVETETAVESPAVEPNPETVETDPKVETPRKPKLLTNMRNKLRRVRQPEETDTTSSPSTSAATPPPFSSPTAASPSPAATSPVEPPAWSSPSDVDAEETSDSPGTTTSGQGKETLKSKFSRLTDKMRRSRGGKRKKGSASNQDEAEQSSETGQQSVSPLLATGESFGVVPEDEEEDYETDDEDEEDGVSVSSASLDQDDPAYLKNRPRKWHTIAAAVAGAGATLMIWGAYVLQEVGVGHIAVARI